MLLSTLAGLAGAFTLATAPTVGAPPVSVVACDYTSQAVSAATTALAATEVPYQLGDLRISFVNQAPLEATNVRFAVSYAGVTQIVDDNGRFATGAAITHDFQPVGAAAYNAGAAECAVESVTFADGSSWQPS